MRKSYNQNTGGLRSVAAAIVGLNIALASQGQTSSAIGFANAAPVAPQSMNLLQIENEQKQKSEIATGLGEVLDTAHKLEVEEGLSKKEALIDASMMELNRYFNSKDEAIDLSKSHNHARIVLNKRRRNFA